MDSIHAVVPKALAELFRHGPMSQGKLDVAWRVAVGETLCRASTVRLQAGGSVDVHPADQRWHKELKRSSSMILERLNALLGANTVTRLVVK
jgi:Dna[CI] antecedent DciA-like protein